MVSVTVYVNFLQETYASPTASFGSAKGIAQVGGSAGLTPSSPDGPIVVTATGVGVTPNFNPTMAFWALANQIYPCYTESFTASIAANSAALLLGMFNTLENSPLSATIALDPSLTGVSVISPQYVPTPWVVTQTGNSIVISSESSTMPCLPFVQIVSTDGNIGTVQFTGANVGAQSLAAVVGAADPPPPIDVVSPISITAIEGASVLSLEEDAGYYVDGISNFNMTGTPVDPAQLPQNLILFPGPPGGPTTFECIYSCAMLAPKTAAYLELYITVSSTLSYAMVNIDVTCPVSHVVLPFAHTTRNGWIIDYAQTTRSGVTFTLAMRYEDSAHEYPTPLYLGISLPPGATSVTINAQIPPIGAVVQAVQILSAVPSTDPVAVHLTATTEVVARATGAVVQRTVSRSSTLTRYAEDAYLSACPSLSCLLSRSLYEVRTTVEVSCPDGRYEALIVPHVDTTMPATEQTVVVHRVVQ